MRKLVDFKRERERENTRRLWRIIYPRVSKWLIVTKVTNMPCLVLRIFFFFSLFSLTLSGEAANNFWQLLTEIALSRQREIRS
jgi:hypothetical protein